MRHVHLEGMSFSNNSAASVRLVLLPLPETTHVANAQPAISHQSLEAAHVFHAPSAFSRMRAAPRAVPVQLESFPLVPPARTVRRDITHQSEVALASRVLEASSPKREVPNASPVQQAAFQSPPVGVAVNVKPAFLRKIPSHVNPALVEPVPAQPAVHVRAAQQVKFQVQRVQFARAVRGF